MRSYISLIEHLLLEKFDPDDFVERVRSTNALIHGGATEGEKAGAKHALARLSVRAKQEIAHMRSPGSGVTPTQISRFMQALQRLGAMEDQPASAPPASPQSLDEPFEILDIANHGNDLFGIAERGGYTGQTYLFWGQLHGPLQTRLCATADEAYKAFEAQQARGFQVMQYGGHLPDAKGRYVRVGDWVAETLEQQFAPKL